MSNSRTQQLAFVMLSTILSSCVPSAKEGTQGDNSIKSHLEAKAAQHYGQNPRWVRAADSTPSAVVPGLTYHWIFVVGDEIHDMRFFTVARAEGRLFDVGDLADWGPLFGTWQPRTEREALSFCAEAVAVGVLAAPQRLADSTSLTLDAKMPSLDAHTHGYLARAMNGTEVVPPSAISPSWDVRYWYLNGFPTRGGRLATRYHCRISPKARSLSIEVVDSINPSTDRRAWPAS